ncbi:hypothetical protein BVY00_01525 [bacterium G20]|nr:hypothetical protein BVY00_01525 [bacterium G20]
MKSNASLFYSFILVVGDFLALVAAFVGAYILRGTLSSVPVAHPIPATTYLGVFLTLLPFWILFFGLLGLYSSSIQEKRFNELGRLLIGSFVGLLFVIGYGYGVNKIIFPARLVPVYGFILAFLFLLIFRNLARAVRAYLYKYGIGITNILIVGNTKIASELVKSLSNSKISGYRIVGIVGSKSHTPERFPHIPIFDSFDEAVKKIHASDIHSIVQTELYVAQDANNEILEFAQTHHIAYRFVPGNSELFVGNIAVELFRSQIPVIAVHQTALIGWGRIVKRLTDIVLGGFFLILALPFMLIIALVIKIFDPMGPVLFKDSRLTRFRNVIKVYKFRSHKKAYTNLTPEQAFAKMGRPELASAYRAGGDQIPNDPRISRIGRVLRRTSLDELPQLINIVKGDISLVGPRALQPHELERHDKKDLILAIKSGLTGLAQVSGRRDISVEERRKLDLYYVQNWSLWLDLIILAKTARVVLRRIGAK